MPTESSSWRTVLSDVKKRFPDLNQRYSFKFVRLVAMEAEKHDLSERDTNSLALTLGIKCYPRPTNLPENWKLVICKSFVSQKYLHPKDPFESVIVKAPIPIGKLPYILHRTSQGFADRTWFTEVVPELEKIVGNLFFGRPFIVEFNEKVNALFPNGMTHGQLEAINLFFGKYVPGIEGICPRCYKVSLPNSWAGEKWVSREKSDYEIRLSAAKPNARYLSQQVEYVSHTELDDNGNEVFACCDPKGNPLGLVNNMSQHGTHIPWEVYDFNKFSLRMPKCRCRVQES